MRMRKLLWSFAMLTVCRIPMQAGAVSEAPAQAPLFGGTGRHAGHLLCEAGPEIVRPAKADVERTSQYIAKGLEAPQTVNR